jgi:large subunit ribosomal protein L1
MGKIRVKSFEEEGEDKKLNKKEQARAEAIKAAEAAKLAASTRVEREAAAAAEARGEEPSETQAEVAPKKKVVAKQDKKHKHSKSYTKVSSLVDKNKKYKLNEALELLEKLKRAKFDESVELHFNTHDKGISGNFTLPHGTGKQTRVAIANQTEDPKAVEELVKNIEAGQIDFDVLIATPDAMPKLARVARVLGPRGLMPNPKNGTVTTKPSEAAKVFEGGQMNFKTESKFPLLHLTVGKVSFGEKKLADNIKVVVEAVKTRNIKAATIKATMSPGLKLEVSSL